MAQQLFFQHERAFSPRTAISRVGAWISHASPVGTPSPVRAEPTGVRDDSEAFESEDVTPAMKQKEVVRARAFGRGVTLLSLIALVVHQVNNAGTDRPLRTATAIAIAVLGANAAYVWYRADPERSVYSPLLLRTFGVVAVITSFIFELNMGILSPITGVVVLGLSFFGMARSRRSVTGLGTLAIGGYCAAGLLTALEVVPDLGIFSMSHVPRATRVGMVIMFTGVYVVALVQARLTHRATQRAMELATKAAREARLKGAQLAEANHNLDMALALGGGLRRGRCTGQRAGDYRLGEIVGRGAMGEVYAARHEGTGLPAAIKVLHVTMTSDPTAVERFWREARSVATIQSRHVIQVFELGRMCDGTPFIAMELLEGHDLGWHLRHTGRLSVPEAVRLVGEVADGLTSAHDAGVIHRDLKPQNLFAVREAQQPVRWKILDFGVCALRDSEGTLTRGDAVGTPGYMAPEQALGMPSGPRADVFSLGAVLYRALTGAPPFQGGGSGQVLLSVVHTNPVRPRAHAPWIRDDIEAVLAIALAKRPDDRFESAVEMASAFEAAAAGKLSTRMRALAERVVRESPWAAGDAATLPR
jgi:serine/threonine-protein kinase